MCERESAGTGGQGWRRGTEASSAAAAKPAASAWESDACKKSSLACLCAEALRKEVGELRGRLEDSRAQVASNEQMIRWLNNQITETQLHYSAGAAGLMASRYSYRPAAPVPPAGSGSSATAGAAPGAASTAGLPAPGALAGGYGSVARPAVSTYRTPGTVTSVGATGGLPPPSVGSTAPPGSTGSSVLTAPAAGFRSNFYATHFGGGAAAGSGAAGAPAAAGAAAARSLDLGGAGSSRTGDAPRAAAALPTATAPGPAVGTTSAPAAGAAAPSAVAKYLSRFEVPTFRMADTAGGRVAVPVTSGT